MGNTNIPTCAVDRVDTAQNNCHLRNKAFNQAITVNDTRELAVDPDYTAIDGLVNNRFLHLWYMIDSFDTTGRPNGKCITPINMQRYPNDPKFSDR